MSCFCENTSYCSIYNDAYNHEQKIQWINHWISRLKKSKCMRCKSRIVRCIKKALETQTILLSLPHEYYDIILKMHDKCLREQRAAKILTKRIAKHLYKPDGVMMKKHGKMLVDLQNGNWTNLEASRLLKESWSCAQSTCLLTKSKEQRAVRLQHTVEWNTVFGTSFRRSNLSWIE